MLLAIATNEQEEVVDALLESVETPAQLECQDSVRPLCKLVFFSTISKLLSMFLCSVVKPFSYLHVKGRIVRWSVDYCL